METTNNNFLKDNYIVIRIGDDNKFTLPVKNTKGNIGNVINFLVYAFTISGLSYEEVFAEIAQYLHYKVEMNNENKNNEKLI